MSQERFGTRLFDTALLIAVVSAICYVLGFVANMSIVTGSGVPLNLLPEGKDVTAIFGGLLLLLYLMLGLLLYVIFVLLERRYDRLAAVRRYLQTRFHEHRVAFPLLLLGVNIALVTLLATYVLAPYVGRLVHRIDTMPRVVGLQTKSNQVIRDLESLHYLATKDGYVILCNFNKNQFLMIRDEEIESLRIEAPYN